MEKVLFARGDRARGRATWLGVREASDDDFTGDAATEDEIQAEMEAYSA